MGIAGEVDNNEVYTTNCRHWPRAKGEKIAENLGLKQVVFINDFSAAG